MAPCGHHAGSWDSSESHCLFSATEEQQELDGEGSQSELLRQLSEPPRDQSALHKGQNPKWRQRQTVIPSLTQRSSGWEDIQSPGAFWLCGFCNQHMLINSLLSKLHPHSSNPPHYLSKHFLKEAKEHRTPEKT